MPIQELLRRTEQAEQTVAILQAGEERVRLAMAAGRLYFWDWDITTDKISWSGGLEKELMIEEPPSSIASFKALVHPDDADYVSKQVELALRGPANYTAEFRMVRSDGSVRWTATRAIVVRSSSGEPIRMVGSDQDITEYKESLQREVETQARLRASLCSLSAAEAACKTGTWDWDTPHDCVYVSPAYRELYGLQPDEQVTYESWLARVDPRDRARAVAYNEAFFATGTSYDLEFRIQHPVQGERWLAALGRMTRDADGKPVRFTGINIDISERVETHRALQVKQATFELGLQLSGVGLAEIDYEVGTIKLDERAGALLELPHEHPIARSVFHSRVHKDDRHRVAQSTEWLLGPEGTGLLDVEHRVSLPSGEQRWIIARKKVFYSSDADGTRRARHGLLALSDITERKQAEARISLLLGEVTHRSKNILSLVQAVARQTAITTGSKQWVDAFEQRLLAIASSHNLLVESSWTHVGVRELCQAQLRHFEELLGSRILLVGEAAYLSPQAAQILGMAIHELATNAAKYGALSNQTGVVTVSWEQRIDVSPSIFCFRWLESHGPRVSLPRKRGFGHTVMVTIPGIALGADASLDYLEDGVSWNLTCPLARLSSDSPKEATSSFKS
jgi:PAS domain S-box-containing protein